MVKPVTGLPQEAQVSQPQPKPSSKPGQLPSLPADDNDWPDDGEPKYDTASEGDDDDSEMLDGTSRLRIRTFLLLSTCDVTSLDRQRARGYKLGSSENRICNLVVAVLVIHAVCTLLTICV